MTPATGKEGRIWTLAFANLWVVGFCAYSSVYSLLTVLPLYLQDLGWPAAVVGALLGLMSTAALVARPFAGFLTDRLGRRPLIAGGLAGMVTGTLGLPVATGAGLFGALRLIFGLGWGGFSSTANTLAGDLAPAGRRGEALGLYTTAGGIAMAVGPVTGLHLARTYGFQTAFIVAGALAAMALLMSRFLPETASPPAAGARLKPADLVCRPALLPAAVLALHMMTYGTLLSFLPLLAREQALGNPGLFFTANAVGLTLMRGVAGRLSDRLGRSAVMAPGALAGAATMLLLALASAPWQMLAAAVLYSLAHALVQPPALAWGLDLAGGRPGTGMATMVAAQDLGIALGSATLGLVYGLAGYRGIFAAASLLGLAAAGLLLAQERR